jgi:CRP-like cAMP-binding protein
MLTIKSAFERLKKLLTKVNPAITLPATFFDYLWKEMDEITPDPDVPLVRQGDIPKFAYFIIRGFLSVYYVDEEGDKYMKRFYKEDQITAFLSFLEQQPSPYTIVPGKDTLLSRISIAKMEEIYKGWTGMKEFAQLTVMQYEEKKEGIKDRLMQKKGEQRVLAFYLLYPGLLHSKVFVDSDIASYLRLTRETLCTMRAALIDKCLLPGKKRG